MDLRLVIHKKVRSNWNGMDSEVLDKGGLKLWLKMRWRGGVEGWRGGVGKREEEKTMQDIET